MTSEYEDSQVSKMGELQFGHDSSPWMTYGVGVVTAKPNGLQFGHDSSPWMTGKRGMFG